MSSGSSTACQLFLLLGRNHSSHLRNLCFSRQSLWSARVEYECVWTHTTALKRIRLRASSLNDADHQFKSNSVPQRAHRARRRARSAYECSSPWVTEIQNAHLDLQAALTQHDRRSKRSPERSIVHYVHRAELEVLLFLKVERVHVPVHELVRYLSLVLAYQALPVSRASSDCARHSLPVVRMVFHDDHTTGLTLWNELLAALSAVSAVSTAQLTPAKHQAGW